MKYMDNTEYFQIFNETYIIYGQTFEDFFQTSDTLVLLQI